MCPILLLLPAAAFSSHQESTEYSENLELVEVIQAGPQMWEADGVSLLQHALLWEMGVSMELTCVRGTWKHQLVTSPQCPLGTACRGGIAFLDLPVPPSCSPLCGCSAHQSSCTAPVPKWKKWCYSERKSGVGQWFYAVSRSYGLFNAKSMCHHGCLV